MQVPQEKPQVVRSTKLSTVSAGGRHSKLCMIEVGPGIAQYLAAGQQDVTYMGIFEWLSHSPSSALPSSFNHVSRPNTQPKVLVAYKLRERDRLFKFRLLY